jgi:methylated-DNA-[protein]-cysteine S-methyltransferase
MEYIHLCASPLGAITMASDGTALTGLWFDGQRRFPACLENAHAAALPVFDQAEEWLRVYFSGKAPDFTPALNPVGTDFRRAVWDILLKIPYAETRSYGEIAQALARRRGLQRMSAQAVGGAVGHNPISLIIPCHRVIGADGSLTGYAGGIDRKRKLLEMEAAAQNI